MIKDEYKQSNQIWKNNNEGIVVNRHNRNIPTGKWYLMRAKRTISQGHQVKNKNGGGANFI